MFIEEDMPQAIADAAYGRTSALEPAQLSLLGDQVAGWCGDDWETPSEVASKMAALVKPTDRRILEPAAGTGQIAKHLPRRKWLPDVQCWEIQENRCIEGEKNAPHCWWLQQNFLSDFLLDAYKNANAEGFDLIITNPPFSLALQFIERSLQLLDRTNPEARLLYLLPCDVFQSKERGDRFKALDCHIHHRYLIQGRVAYLKNGVPFSGRQLSDCVYDIRPGKENASESYL